MKKQDITDCPPNLSSFINLVLYVSTDHVVLQCTVGWSRLISLWKSSLQ